MTRRPLIWILAAAVVVAVVIVAVALSGDDDGSADTISAADWAENVCAVVGFWRGEMDAIAADAGALTEASVRSGLERALVETERVVDAIDAPGVPDTENGEETAEQVTSWANGAINDLNQAHGALETATGGDALDERRSAVATIEGVVESGRQVLADIALTDPELAEAIRDSGTCQEVQAGTSA